jgi:hypothetical protein
MNVSSTVWILLIAAGATLVAIGNIQYNLARDREKGVAASQKALSMLTEESARNLESIDQMQKVLKTNQVRIQGFETAAWNVVSSSGLLTQVDREALEEIIGVYHLVELANKYHAQIIDMSMGLASVIGGVEDSRKKYIGLLSQTLEELTPKLRVIVTQTAKMKT